MCERDVVRCDRCHPYFQQEENIELLKDILMCYIMYDFDTGNPYLLILFLDF